MPMPWRRQNAVSAGYDRAAPHCGQLLVHAAQMSLYRACSSRICSRHGSARSLRCSGGTVALATVDDSTHARARHPQGLGDLAAAVALRCAASRSPCASLHPAWAASRSKRSNRRRDVGLAARDGLLDFECVRPRAVAAATLARAAGAHAGRCRRGRPDHSASAACRRRRRTPAWLALADTACGLARISSRVRSVPAASPRTAPRLPDSSASAA